MIDYVRELHQSGIGHTQLRLAFLRVKNRVFYYNNFLKKLFDKNSSNNLTRFTQEIQPNLDQ